MNELQTVGNNQVSLTPVQRVKALLERKKIMKTVLDELMKPEIHYYKFNGKGNNVLTKTGAEVLCNVFGLAAKFDDKYVDMSNGHFRVIIKCSIFSVDTGLFLGEGIGAATTKETKHKYRYEKSLDDNGKPLKDERGWDIKEKVENEETEDLYNTIYKMAAKRAHVAATLIVTGAGDIFENTVEVLELDDSIDESILKVLKDTLKDTIKTEKNFNELVYKWGKKLKDKIVNTATHKAGEEFLEQNKIVDKKEDKQNGTN